MFVVVTILASFTTFLVGMVVGAVLNEKNGGKTLHEQVKRMTEQDLEAYIL